MDLITVRQLYKNTAEFAGKEVEIGRVNYVLRALNIPAGHHTITFRFDPTSIRTADTVATIAIVLIYLTLLAAVNISLYRHLRRKSLTEQTD